MRLLPICLLLAACSGTQSTTVFTGPQRPIAGACDLASHATLTRRGNALTLSPADGTLTLTGTAVGNTLTAETTLPGADKKPYRITFTGQLETTRVTGTLTTPRCRYALTLDKTDD